MAVQVCVANVTPVCVWLGACDGGGYRPWVGDSGLGTARATLLTPAPPSTHTQPCSADSTHTQACRCRSSRCQQPNPKHGTRYAPHSYTRTHQQPASLPALHPHNVPRQVQGASGSAPRALWCAVCSGARTHSCVQRNSSPTHPPPPETPYPVTSRGRTAMAGRCIPPLGQPATTFTSTRRTRLHAQRRPRRRRALTYTCTRCRPARCSSS